MLAHVEPNTMSNKKAGRPSSGKREVTARIDVEVMRKVKYLASIEGITIGEYLTQVLDPVVSKRYREHLESELKTTDSKAKDKGRG